MGGVYHIQTIFILFFLFFTRPLNLVRACIERRRKGRQKRVMVMDVLSKRRKGRPEWRWMDSIKDDLTEKGLTCE